MSRNDNADLHLAVEFKVVLRADDLLSIGWGYPGLTGTNIQLFRFKPSISSEPVIPGSTIKGVLRTASIRVAKMLGLNVCREVDPELIKAICSPDDILLDMFGKPGNNAPSRLIVEPFIIEDSSRTTILKHVSIDRNSMRAVKGALYSSEHIIPCTLIKGNIVLDLRDLKDIDRATKMLELLMLALLELEDLGVGRGSRKVSVVKVDINKDVLKLLEEKRILTPLSRKILNALMKGRDKPCIR